MTNWLAGMKITAARLQDNAVLRIDQGSDQTVTSSSTVVDSSIVAAVAANTTYEFQLFASYSADTGGDIKWSWTMPSGGSIRRFTQSYDSAATASGSAGQTVVLRAPAAVTAPVTGGTGIANFHSFFDSGLFITGSTAGNFVMQFAQGTPFATGTILRANTFLTYQKIG